MSPKNKPLSKAELEAYEAKRDLAAELLQSVREMKAGQVSVVMNNEENIQGQPTVL